jgi:hypothetical protein
MWQIVCNLIRQPFWRRFRHEKDSIKGGSKGSYSRQISDQMGDNNVVNENRAAGRLRDMSATRQGDLADSVDMPIEGRVLKINEGSMCASDPGNFASYAWDSFDHRRNVGFLGHDGVPWLWEADKQCWLPVTESSRAADYAALQARTRPV